MAKMKVLKQEVGTLQLDNQDYISLTDIANAKDSGTRAADIIKNWLRNRSTLEFIGTWEHLYNPNFKVVEFDHFRMSARLHSFVLSPAKWIEKTNANVNQLVCLANRESLNAHFIEEKLTQAERVDKLNKIAISQMKILVKNNKLQEIEKI